MVEPHSRVLAILLAKSWRLPSHCLLFMNIVWNTR